MTTVRDIQAGNYCTNCSIDCIHYNRDADCCDCDTIVGRLYSQCVDSEYINTEMKFEPRK